MACEIDAARQFAQSAEQIVRMFTASIEALRQAAEQIARLTPPPSAIDRFHVRLWRAVRLSRTTRMATEPPHTRYAMRARKVWRLAERQYTW